MKPIVKELPEPLIEGWGLSHDSSGNLYATDGSYFISIINPIEWQIVRQIKVVDD